MVSNSIKFTSFGGRISIGAKYSDGKIIVTVKDSGKGLEKNQI